MKIINNLKTYNDDLNNSIDVSAGTKVSDLKIKFLESSASIIIGENTNLTDSEVIIGKGSKLIVGANSILNRKNKYRLIFNR